MQSLNIRRFFVTIGVLLLSAFIMLQGQSPAIAAITNSQADTITKCLNSHVKTVGVPDNPNAVMADISKDQLYSCFSPEFSVFSWGSSIADDVFSCLQGNVQYSFGGNNVVYYYGQHVALVDANYSEDTVKKCSEKYSDDYYWQ